MMVRIAASTSARSGRTPSAGESLARSRARTFELMCVKSPCGRRPSRRGCSMAVRCGGAAKVPGLEAAGSIRDTGRKHATGRCGMLTKRVFLAGAAALASGATLGGAFAESPYPSRTIRIMVGYAAGGGVDIVARLIGDPMGRAFHQTIIVEDRPGASAMIASNI